MLELPEAQTIARQLRETIVGQRVIRAVAAQSPHGFAFYFSDPATYSGLLEGRVIDDVQALGGRVLFSLGDVRLSLNDGALLRFYESLDSLPVKHQLLLKLDGGSALVCTVQMYAGIAVYPEGALDAEFYYTVARDKPSPLSDAFDRAYFDSIVNAANPKISAKALLATEQRIPGLGNGCSQDILFRAGINPQSKLSALPESAMDALYTSVKETLSDMTAGGGRDTEKDLFGKPGGYRTLLSSKTVRLPCPRCGGIITRKAYLGGNVYFCQTCQPI